MKPLTNLPAVSAVTEAGKHAFTATDQPSRCRLVVFAKAPVAGAVKTRLIPALGAHGAAALAQRMLTHTLTQALASGVGPVELCMSPASDSPAWQGVALPDGIERSDQGEGDLGERMARAVHRVTTLLAQPVLLVGTDCPALMAERLVLAAKQLALHDGVLFPAVDGGYVLLGLHAPHSELFSGMQWSTSVVASETLRRMTTQAMRVWQAPMLNDVDEPADLVHLPSGFL